jgi:hypothetical protein
MRYKAAHCIVVYAATAAERHAPYGRGPAALGTDCFSAGECAGKKKDKYFACLFFCLFFEAFF